MPEPISRRRWWMLAACGLVLAIAGAAWWIMDSAPDPLRSRAPGKTGSVRRFSFRSPIRC
jgi:ferric-dicitrate binding protein FerR (iron transport regulator)